MAERKSKKKKAPGKGKKKQRKTALEREREYMTMKRAKHEISDEEMEKWLDKVSKETVVHSVR